MPTLRDVGMPSAAGMREVLVLQYLRGFAAMAVVIYHVLLGVDHYGPHPRATSPFGAAGVDLFFVISGFIMFYVTAQTRPGPWRFLSARLLRVLPLYWIVTLVMFLMPYVSRTIGWSSSLSAPHLLTSLFCIGGVHWPGIDGDYPVYRAGWTINYEIFFYAVYAVCLTLKPAWRSAAGTCIVLLALVTFGTVGNARSSIAGFYTAPILLEFLFGIGVAWAYMRVRIMPTRLAWIMLFVGIGLLYLLADAPARGFAKGMPAALIVASALSLEQEARRRPSALLKLLGDASYSIYLTHLFTLPAAEMVFRRLTTELTNLTAILYIVVGTVAAAGGGVGCFYLVERPLHRQARKLLQRGSRRPVS